MSRRAWTYMLSVIAIGGALMLISVPTVLHSLPPWLLFVILTGFATVAHLFEAEGPNNETWNANLTFYYAGVLLLSPFYFALLVLIPHLIHWAIVRLQNGPTLRQWYIQPFNIATHLMAGFAAKGMYLLINPTGELAVTLLVLIAALIGVAVYVSLNHFLIAAILVLARGHSWRQSGLFDLQNFLSDSALACLGYVFAILWQLNPWLIFPALTPLLMTYRALKVPRLQQEAKTDPKTGLYNPRHFTTLFTQEVQRAQRFNRPLAVVMADLDLLRNINNTYGHLAGDAVLAELGKLIHAGIREYDIAARFGGEEFSVVILEAGLREARAFAERIRRTVETAEFTIPTSPTPIHVTMSLGVACFPSDAGSVNDLLHLADVAMYQAKLRGRNCVVCATDVPHSISLGETPEAGDHTKEYLAAQLSAATEQPIEKATPADKPTAPPASRRTSLSLWTWLFVGGLIASGGLVMVWGLLGAHNPIAWPMLIVLVGLAAAAEWLQVNIYGSSTVSVSVAVNFAAAMMAGMPGIMAVSATIVLVHFLQIRPAIYQALFNWVVHVLAGTLPLIILGQQSFTLNPVDLIRLAALGTITALGYYAIETGLVSVVIALEQGQLPVVVWRQQFSWLLLHYLILCLMGAMLAVSYAALGLAGLIVFALPPFMMRYAQKQYVDQTTANMRELQRLNQELTRANQEVRGASQAMRALNEELFLMLAKIVDARDPFVSSHTTKVADYATALAQELKLPLPQVEQIRQAALLHDVGKIGLSEQLLRKPAQLTPEEYRIVQKHPALGADLLETCQGLRQLAPLVRHHHEWWDGTGYPAQLQGEDIPLGARILAVCDAVEAMASDRPYSQARSHDEIIVELRRCAGTQFDPQIVEAFAHMIEQRGRQFIVNSAREAQASSPDASDADTSSIS